MANLSNKPARLVTPKGEANYPWLTTPDTEYDENGVYSCQMIFDDNSKTQEMIGHLEDIRDSFIAEFKNDPRNRTKRVEEADIGEWMEDGRFKVRFKSKAKFQDRQGNFIDINIPIFDAHRQPVGKDIKLGSGSILRLSYTPVPYYMPSTRKAGVTLRINAVMIVQLKEYSNGSGADGFGFEEDEEGYVSNNPANDFNDADDESSTETYASTGDFA